MSERYTDPARRSLDIARAWRAAAVADGWTNEPVYQGGDIAHASKHTRGNLKASVYTQPGTNSGSVSVWGISDGAAVDVPDVYDWGALQANLRRCSECGAEDVECGRVHFATRVCLACKPDVFGGALGTEQEHEGIGPCHFDVCAGERTPR